MKNADLKNKKDNILAIIGILFFIGLAIGGRIASTREEIPPTETQAPTAFPDVEKKETFSILESLHNRNDHFTYTITENDKVEIIDGKANGNKMKFTLIGDQNEEYAKLSSNYLKYTNGKFEIIKTEIRSYFPYIMLDNIEEILKQSVFKKEENVQIFEIETIDLLDKYTEIEYTGFEEFKNDQIKIYKTDNQIVKIEIDYSNYFSYVKTSPYTFQVTMEFRDFGAIEELEI